MAWYDTATPILRTIINDLDAENYTNARLRTVMSSNAYLLCSELSFNNTYTVSIVDESISPDPDSDKDFITLLCLKSAVFIYLSESKLAERYGMEVWDGPSKIDTKSRIAAAKDNYEHILDLYNRAKTQYSMSQGKGGVFVLSPYTHPDVIRGKNI